jgi:uncharacterized SAM-binding protein YcdF (DUF218 family)
MSDAIIVLGRGIRDDGTLPIDPQSRVKKAVELYSNGRASHIVMSGAWTYHFDISPIFAESTAMKNYAIELGVPSDHIIEESKSMDTIGNVYFTKKDVCEPRGWKSLAIVASDEHMPRIEYLFRKIYGPEYSFEFEISNRVIDGIAYQKETEHETSSMKVTKQWLESLELGDDEAVWNLMTTIHPAYRPHGETSTGPPESEKDLYPDMP